MLERCFFLCDCNFKILGTCNAPLDRCCQNLYSSISQSPKFLKVQLVKPKKIYSYLVTVEQVGQKNHKKKTTIVIFCNVSYECIEGKSGICLLLAMFIGDDWMVYLMIIYIKKTIAKTLDINGIIKNLWGCTGGSFLVKLNTMCGQNLLPLYYMP